MLSAIVCQWWMLFLALTIVSGVIVFKNTDDGYMSFDVSPLIWLIVVLVFWLIYFIVN